MKIGSSYIKIALKLKFKVNDINKSIDKINEIYLKVSFTIAQLKYKR